MGPFTRVFLDDEERAFVVGAQSRKRLITPGSDNYGFARYVWENAGTLVELLGSGRHYGEWWGQGIQRRYGMSRKVFSLFNTHRWGPAIRDASGEPHPFGDKGRAIGLDVVPVLYVGSFRSDAVAETLDQLCADGSYAARRYGVKFDDPEGVIVYHQELRANLKAFCENDDIPKSALV